MTDDEARAAVARSREHADQGEIDTAIDLLCQLCQEDGDRRRLDLEPEGVGLPLDVIMRAEETAGAIERAGRGEVLRAKLRAGGFA